MSETTTPTSRKTPPDATGTPGDHPDIAHVASLLADRSRASMLFALTGDRALPASMLAAEASVSTSTASGHLTRLVDADLIRVEQHGRHRYFRLASPEVATALETLATIAPPLEVTGLRGHNRLQRLRSARTCYDHLAGRVGTQLMSWLTAQHAIARTDGHTGTSRSATDQLSAPVKSAPYQLGDQAAEIFGDWGINLDELRRRRRPLIRVCVDWTEQSHHLAGGLGATLLHAFTQHGWIKPTNRPREIDITPDGEHALPGILTT